MDKKLKKNKTKSCKDKIPEKDAREILDKKIVDLWKLGWSYDEICVIFKVSKKTVYNAIKRHEASKAERHKI